MRPRRISDAFMTPRSTGTTGLSPGPGRLSCTLHPLCWSSLGAPMTATLATLRLLARRAAESRGGVGAEKLAQRVHAKVVFILARQLHSLACDCLGTRRAQHLWPDWAERPPETDVPTAVEPPKSPTRASSSHSFSPTTIQ